MVPDAPPEALASSNGKGRGPRRGSRGLVGKRRCDQAVRLVSPAMPASFAIAACAAASRAIGTRYGEQET